MQEIIKYMFYYLNLFISRAVGNDPDGLTWVIGLIDFATVALILLLAALLFFCFLLINHYFFMDRATILKEGKIPAKKKIIGVLVFTITLLSVILSSYEQTKIYGFLLFGFIFVGSGIFVVAFRALFDISEKAIVSGTLMQLEHIIEVDGYSSYRPHYQYVFKDNNYILKSQFAAFWCKKTKQIGEVISIVINVKSPKNARINKPIYTFLEYLVEIVLIGAGIFIVLLGINF